MAQVYTIDVSGLQELKTAFLKAPKATVDALDEAMLDVTSYLQRTVQDETVPVVTGMLRASVFGTHEVSETGAIGVVGSPLIYALPVEIGREPRARNLHQGANESPAAFEGRQRRAGPSTKGFEGRRMFQRAIEARSDYIRDRFVAAVAKVFNGKGAAS